jgi:hypothetical protein
MSETKALTPIAMDEKGIQLASLEDGYRFAKYVIASRLAPKGIDTPEKALICMQAGMELGMGPFQGLQSIVPINGKATIPGEPGLALVRRAGLMEVWKGAEYTGGEMTDEWTCTVTSRRKGESACNSTSFSVADAKRANLWGKAGPWTQYPKRMLFYRALGFHLRDFYPDGLRGLGIAEEVRDYPNAAPPAPTEQAPADPLLAAADGDDDPDSGPDGAPTTADDGGGADGEPSAKDDTDPAPTPESAPEEPAMLTPAKMQEKLLALSWEQFSDAAFEAGVYLDAERREDGKEIESPADLTDAEIMAVYAVVAKGGDNGSPE